MFSNQPNWASLRLGSPMMCASGWDINLHVEEDVVEVEVLDMSKTPQRVVASAHGRRPRRPFRDRRGPGDLGGAEPEAPRPLTREQFDGQIASAAEGGAQGTTVSFVVDLDGAAVGGVSLFNFDLFAGQAEVGISLLPNARGRGIGSAANRHR